MRVTETYEIPRSRLFKRRHCEEADKARVKFDRLFDLLQGDPQLVCRFAFSMMMKYKAKGEDHIKDAEFWRAVLHIGIRKKHGMDPRDKRLKKQFFIKNEFSENRYGTDAPTSLVDRDKRTTR